jgi:hypothetical protein
VKTITGKARADMLSLSSMYQAQAAARLNTRRRALRKQRALLIATAPKLEPGSASITPASHQLGRTACSLLKPSAKYII